MASFVLLYNVSIFVQRRKRCPESREVEGGEGGWEAAAERCCANSCLPEEIEDGHRDSGSGKESDRQAPAESDRRISAGRLASANSSCRKCRAEHPPRFQWRGSW